MTHASRHTIPVSYWVYLERKATGNCFDDIVLYRRFLLEDWEAYFPGMVRRAYTESGLHHIRCEKVKVTWSLGRPATLGNLPGVECSPVVLEVTSSGVKRRNPSIEDSIQLNLFLDQVMGIIRERVVPEVDFAERGEVEWVNPETEPPQ